jgi:hypothetical protein
MLGSFKRLFGRVGGDRDLTLIAEWAQRREYGYKRARGEDGFVIDGQFEGRPWRIEWGPPQRPYIQGHELRIRMELELPSEMQMLVLSRPLMDSLERQTFEEFTDKLQTQIGTKTPEEMRWLVMFPKLNLTAFKSLKLRFGAVASTPAAGIAWLGGALATMLDHASHDLLRADPPFVLMTLRSRAYLRLQLLAPDPKAVAGALALFETGIAQALRTAAEIRNEPPAGAAADWGNRDSTQWQSFQPSGIVPPKDI